VAVSLVGTEKSGLRLGGFDTIHKLHAEGGKGQDGPIETNCRCGSLTQAHHLYVAGIAETVFATGFPETRHFVATEGIVRP
jgi:hypothetical protein